MAGWGLPSVLFFESLSGLFLLFLLVVTHLVDVLTHFAVRLESLYKDIIGGFVETCIRAGGINSDPLLLQLLHHGGDGDIEFFGGLTNFFSRHILF